MKLSRKLERQARWTAIAAGVIGLGMAGFEPGTISLAYRFAVFSCLAPAVGCLILVLIHRITGGQWTSDLAPFLRAGTSLLPWIWLCVLPLLFRSPLDGAGASPPAPAGHGYASLLWVAIRAGLFAAVFFGLRWAVADGVGRERDPVLNRRSWVGPVGLIVVFFMLTLLADDWFESLEPGWHSTAFPVVWMSGQAVSGLALALLAGLASGAKPGANGRAGRPAGSDWGNLLLTFSVFWCYVAFAQFLIIWAGNLPDEIDWYLRREKGAWAWALPGIAAFGFALPFLLLLSRRVKRSAAGLAGVAGLLLTAQLVYLAWVILPAGGPITAGGAILIASFLIAAGGIFTNRYAAAARRWQEGEPG